MAILQHVDAHGSLSFDHYLLFRLVCLEGQYCTLQRRLYHEFPLLWHIHDPQCHRASEFETADRGNFQKLHFHRDDLAIDIRFHGNDIFVQFVQCVSFIFKVSRFLNHIIF